MPMDGTAVITRTGGEAGRLKRMLRDSKPDWHVYPIFACATGRRYQTIYLTFDCQAEPTADQCRVLRLDKPEQVKAHMAREQLALNEHWRCRFTALPDEFKPLTVENLIRIDEDVPWFET